MLKTLISNYSNFLNFPLDDADLNQILVYLESSQIKKLHFEYGDLLLLISLSFCEAREDYKCCEKIKQYLEIVNKYSENKIPSSLEKWKQKNT